MELNKRKIRDCLRLVSALLFFWLYLPHLLIVCVFLSNKTRALVYSDVLALQSQLNINFRSKTLLLLYFLHNNRYYRNVFYHRIGPAWKLMISWLRQESRDFIIPVETKIGPGLWFAHPYATVLNASKIGGNFKVIHLVTIGKKDGKCPVIGDNVSLGANVTIIGDVKIGNNVIVGAGSVVVKDVPDNCIVAGNPAKVIKYIQ